MREEKVLYELIEEIERGDKLFGRYQPKLLLIAAMVEELGETSRALLHEQYEHKPVEMTSRQECLQLAAIACRFIRDWYESPTQ